MKLTALSVVVVCLSLQTFTAKPILASEVDDSAVIYFYRGIALTNHPASVYIDEDNVCSVRPKMFCAVDVKPGNHGFAQFPKNADLGIQEKVSIEPGREYFFAFKPNNAIPLGCALMAAYCEDSGWRLVPPERGKKEIRGLKQEEIVVPPGVFSATDTAHFETILVRLGDRVETSFIYSTSEYGVKDGQSATLVEVKSWGDWTRNPDYHLNYPVTAPVRGTVLLTLSVSYDYAAPLKKGEEPTPEKVASFLRAKISNLYYFFVFDPSNRMMVSFFPGFGEPKADEVFGHFPRYFTSIGPERRRCFSAIYATGTVGDSSEEAWKACLLGANASIPSRPQNIHPLRLPEGWNQ
jgi:hypothetical protein